VNVRSVPVDNFAELLGAVVRLIPLPKPLRTQVDRQRPPQPQTPSALPAGPTRPWPVLRLNALPLLDLPAAARRLTEKQPAEIGELRAALRDTRARALVDRLRGGALAAFGADADLAAAGTPMGVCPAGDTVPLEWPADDPDTAQIGLLTDALTLGLGRARGLRHVLRARRSHLVRVGDATEPHLTRLARAAGGDLAGTVAGTPLGWAEAVEVHVEPRGGRWWLLLTPEIWVAPPARCQRPPGSSRARPGMPAGVPRSRTPPPSSSASGSPAATTPPPTRSSMRGSGSSPDHSPASSKPGTCPQAPAATR